MTAPRGEASSVATPSAWNVANGLTVLRMLLVPVFGWLLLADGGHSAHLRHLAAACFAVAMFTDRVDGAVARRRGLVTPFGQVADPIADKALVTMALGGLSALDIVPWWVTVVVLVREWGVTVMRLVVIRHGIMPAGRGGKLKTFLQAFALFALVLPLSTYPWAGLWSVLAWALLWVAVAVTVLTGIDIVASALVLRRTSARAAMKRARRRRGPS